MTFKIGDQVQLNSGSPIMTVTGLGADAKGEPRATCQWFDQQMKHNSAVFPLAALHQYKEEVGSDGAEDDSDFMTR